MSTGSERYRKHKVWETLDLKLEALNAARYGDAKTEQVRNDIIEWLTEASKSKLARQPALYLSALDDLSKELNDLQTGDAEFKRYVGTSRSNTNPLQVTKLETALRALPLPPPKHLASKYVDLLDAEIEARDKLLGRLEQRVEETESALQDRLDKLDTVNSDLDTLRNAIDEERTAIKEVSAGAQDKINIEWDQALADWQADRKEKDKKNNAEALQHITTLAATAKAGEDLAEHAAGSLSARDWRTRSKRERRAAQWMRAGAVAAFVFAGAVGSYIVFEAIREDFDLTLGDGVLRASIALIIGAFGGLLLRESGRHFREADSSEDVVLSLEALAPFYAGSEDEVKIDARKQLGDAVLVRNVLSRFASRDAAKHGAEVNTTELTTLVSDATSALKGEKKDNSS